MRLAYLTPSVQVPTGATLSMPRREVLLALSDRTQMPILEDDYDCELRLGEPTVPGMMAMDGGDRVIYVGTFSKALFPGLPLGYVVGAPALLRALAPLRAAATFQPSLVEQRALAELLARDLLERHVQRVRKRYGERAHAMASALAVPARGRGITYASGEPFRVESVGPPALLLSFAALVPDEIRDGVAELAALARTCVRKRRLAPARRASRRTR